MVELAADEAGVAIAQVIDVELTGFIGDIPVVCPVRKFILDKVIPGIPLPDDFRTAVIKVGFKLDNPVHPDGVSCSREHPIPTHRSGFFATESGIDNGQDVAIGHVVTSW